MKYFLPFILCFSWCITVTAQPTKKPAARPAPKPPTIKRGPLHVDDYKYYIVAHRSQTDEKPEYKPYYTLSYDRNHLDPAASNFSGHGVILDIRTGKEVSWWPGVGKTHWLTKYNMLFNLIPGNRDHMLAFDSTGILKYDVAIATNGQQSAIGYNPIYLSTDWTKGLFEFNQDLWTMDFDPATGKFSNQKQATFNGEMAVDNTFFKGDYVLTGSLTRNSHLVNLKTGKYTLVEGGWVYNNSYITDMFYVTGDKAGYWSLSRQNFVPADKYFHAFWTNPAQTRSLRGTVVEAPDITQSKGYFYYDSGKSAQRMNTPHITEHGSRYLGLHPDLSIRFSPDSTKMLLGDAAFGAVVLDFNKLNETVLPIPTSGGRFGLDYHGEYAWTDNNHIIFNARPDNKVKNEVITEMTKGAYIYNVMTHEYRRLTPYHITRLSPGTIMDRERTGVFTNYDPLIAVYPMPGTGFVIFDANNLLFRCRPDGSELTPIIKFPGLYQVDGPLLSRHPELH